ncbi:hypothetical protein BH23CHL4_BH23CHL4_11780 [soil metagenome]
MSDKYPLPVYLNQKYCFDLLAMMEGGLTQIETVTVSDNSSTEKQGKLFGDLGIRDVFSLISIGFAGERSSSDKSSTAVESTSERIHTPNSLFARVRERLQTDSGLLKHDFEDYEHGAFVEVKAQFRKNPLLDALESIQSLAELAAVMEDKPNNPQRGGRDQKAKPNATQREGNNAFKMLGGLVNQLTQEGSVDLLGKVSEGELSVVLTLDASFLNDQALSEILDGHYFVLGKATRVLTKGDGSSINLLRKTSLGRMPSDALDQLFNAFKDTQTTGFSFPEIVTEIEGPAIQIIPVAIYS